MDKFAVIVDDPKDKTASTEVRCPTCGLVVDTSSGTPLCPTHGSAPFEGSDGK